MLVFKGTQNSKITNKEFPKCSCGCKYYCQKNIWMNEGELVEWVVIIFKLYIEMAPENILLLLVLDSYQCHMASVVAIQQLGVEAEHFVGGCTSLCWPINFRINKALKTFVCKDWEDWMLDSGMNVSVAKPPTWKSRHVIVFQWMPCKTLGGMEFILHFIEFIE